MNVTISQSTLASIITNKGANVNDLSHETGVLLVFLRYFGCVFCKEALYDLSQARKQLEANNVRIVIVHMDDSVTAEEKLQAREMNDLHHVSDPACRHYHDFGLRKGTLRELFGFRAFIGGNRAMLKGVGIPQPGSNIDQMPGLFFIENGQIIRNHTYQSIGDSPDYLKIAGIKK